MDGISVGENIIFITVISTIIIFIIQFIKGILAKTSWGCKIPGGVWVVISIMFGIGIALLANYNALEEILGTAMPTNGILGELATGVIIGAQSKVIYSVATPIGAKLSAVKADSVVKKELLQSVVVSPETSPVEDEIVFLKEIPNKTFTHILVNDKIYKTAMEE